MLAQRSTHYWLWFILFGVVSAIVSLAQHNGMSTETWWLLITGLLGVVFSVRVLSSFARPYDIIIGILFTAVGVLGILHNLGVNLIPNSGSVVNGAIDNSGVLGLSFFIPYALIHLLLGLTSLNAGLRARAAAPSVVVGSQAAA